MHHIKFNIVGLFPIFLSLTCISVIKTEKSENVNFVVFYDIEDNGVANIIDSAIKHYKTELNLGEIYRIGINSTDFNKKSITQKSFENLLTLENQKPIFAFDFTRNFWNGQLIKSIVKIQKFPTISTNVERDDIKYKAWGNLNETMSNYLIEIQSPEITMANLAQKIMMKTNSKEAFVENGNNNFVIVVSKLDPGSKKSPELSTHVTIDTYQSVEHLLPYIDLTVSFIIGSPTTATNSLKNLSNFEALSGGSIFSISYSWFYMSTHVGTEFKCPSYADHLFVLEPQLNQSTGLTKGVKKFGTKNLTDLFYLDVFRSVVQTYLLMKKNGDWKNRVLEDTEYKLDLRKNLCKVLKSENNILGKFDENLKNIFQPNITFKLRSSTPKNQNLPIIGEIVNQKIFIENWTLWKAYYLVKYIIVGAVPDPPFLIHGNENCAFEFIMLEFDKMCFDGFVIDLIRKIQLEHNDTIFATYNLETSYGKLKKNSSNEWSGAIGLIQKKQFDMAFGAFTVTPERAKVVDFSEPFFFDVRNNQSYAFIFQKGKFRKFQASISHGIKKLKNQRYTEQLKKNWFEDYKCNCTLSHEH